MANITSACLLKHRQLIMCRRGTLGTTITNKLSQGTNTDCEELKMKLVDGMMRVLCNYNPDATLNCLKNKDICKIINQCYKLLPNECHITINNTSTTDPTTNPSGTGTGDSNISSVSITDS